MDLFEHVHDLGPLSGESESMMFYNNALQYSDQALGGDEMVYTPVFLKMSRGACVAKL
jgi:hypothetical protein